MNERMKMKKMKEIYLFNKHENLHTKILMEYNDKCLK